LDIWTLALLAVPAVAVILMYNSLVQLRMRANNAWADIDVQLKRRYDLIPNLVEVVKGYAAHERGTLEAVVEARNRAMHADGPAEKGVAEGDLTRSLKSLFALSERYPELRAAENFGRLHDALVAVEDALQNARRYYNAVVRDYNTKIQQVPFNLIAGLLWFEEREFFAVTAAESQPTPISL
jgi:LemA protein